MSNQQDEEDSDLIDDSLMASQYSFDSKDDAAISHLKEELSKIPSNYPAVNNNILVLNNIVAQERETKQNENIDANSIINQKTINNDLNTSDFNDRSEYDANLNKQSAISSSSSNVSNFVVIHENDKSLQNSDYNNASQSQHGDYENKAYSESDLSANFDYVIIKDSPIAQNTKENIKPNSQQESILQNKNQIAIQAIVKKNLSGSNLSISDQKEEHASERSSNISEFVLSKDERDLNSNLGSGEDQPQLDQKSNQKEENEDNGSELSENFSQVIFQSQSQKFALTAAQSQAGAESGEQMSQSQVAGQQLQLQVLKNDPLQIDLTHSIVMQEGKQEEPEAIIAQQNINGENELSSVEFTNPFGRKNKNQAKIKSKLETISKTKTIEEKKQIENQIPIENIKTDQQGQQLNVQKAKESNVKIQQKIEPKLPEKPLKESSQNKNLKQIKLKPVSKPISSHTKVQKADVESETTSIINSKNKQQEKPEKVQKTQQKIESNQPEKHVIESSPIKNVQSIKLKPVSKPVLEEPTNKQKGKEFKAKPTSVFLDATNEEDFYQDDFDAFTIIDKHNQSKQQEKPQIQPINPSQQPQYKSKKISMSEMQKIKIVDKDEANKRLIKELLDKKKAKDELLMKKNMDIYVQEQVQKKVPKTVKQDILNKQEQTALTTQESGFNVRPLSSNDRKLEAMKEQRMQQKIIQETKRKAKLLMDQLGQKIGKGKQFLKETQDQSFSKNKKKLKAEEGEEDLFGEEVDAGGSGDQAMAQSKPQPQLIQQQNQSMSKKQKEGGPLQDQLNQQKIEAEKRIKELLSKEKERQKVKEKEELLQQKRMMDKEQEFQKQKKEQEQMDRNRRLKQLDQKIQIDKTSKEFQTTAQQVQSSPQWLAEQQERRDKEKDTIKKLTLQLNGLKKEKRLIQTNFEKIQQQKREVENKIETLKHNKDIIQLDTNKFALIRSKFNQMNTSTIEPPAQNNKLQSMLNEDKNITALQTAAANRESLFDPSELSVLEQFVQRIAEKNMTLENAFHRMDSDGDQILTMQEIQNNIQQLNLHMSKSDVQLLIDILDKNMDGVVQEEEFVSAITVPLKKSNEYVQIMGRFKDISNPIVMLERKLDFEVRLKHIAKLIQEQEAIEKAGSKEYNRVVEELKQMEEVYGQHSSSPLRRSQSMFASQHVQQKQQLQTFETELSTFNEGNAKMQTEQLQKGKLFIESKQKASQEIEKLTKTLIQREAQLFKLKEDLEVQTRTYDLLSAKQAAFNKLTEAHNNMQTVFKRIQLLNNVIRIQKLVRGYLQRKQFTTLKTRVVGAQKVISVKLKDFLLNKKITGFVKHLSFVLTRRALQPGFSKIRQYFFIDAEDEDIIQKQKQDKLQSTKQQQNQKTSTASEQQKGKGILKQKSTKQQAPPVKSQTHLITSVITLQRFYRRFFKKSVESSGKEFSFANVPPQCQQCFKNKVSIVCKVCAEAFYCDSCFTLCHKGGLSKKNHRFIQLNLAQYDSISYEGNMELLIKDIKSKLSQEAVEQMQKNMEIADYHNCGMLPYKKFVAVLRDDKIFGSLSDTDQTNVLQKVGKLVQDRFTANAEMKKKIEDKVGQVEEGVYVDYEKLIVLFLSLNK